MAAQRPQAQAVLVQLMETNLDAQGRPLLWMRYQHSVHRDVAGVGVTVIYTNQGRAVAQDPSCGGSAEISAGQTSWLACTYRQIGRADGLKIEITQVQFR